LEKEKKAFFEKVRKGYLDLAKKEQRIRIIDGEKTISEVFVEVKKILKDFLARESK
jgi:thymidylate kinase